MQRSDFEGPPIHYSIISVVGAIATATVLIFGLEIIADRLHSSPTQTLESSRSVTPEVVDR